jgi:galactokinase
VRSAARAFSEHFGKEPSFIVAAPGRVNLIGEHTDYNDGFVLPMAIDRYTVMAAGPHDGRDRVVRVHSAAVRDSVVLFLDSPLHPEPPPWTNYVRGVVAGFVRRGVTIPPFCASIASDVPLGGGLSSSAALEVATATLLEAVSETTLGPVEKARLCQAAEHEFCGVPCGLMDPLVSILGEERGPLLIDCRSGDAHVVTFGDPAVSVLIANTNVRHALGDGAYAQRRAECESAALELGVTSLRDATRSMVEAAKARLGPVLHRRARHVVTENERTLAAVRALESGDVRQAGALFYESHDSLRDDYEVSCSELDILVETARALGEASGVYGARMTGGGFGGSTVTLVKSEHVEAVGRALGRAYGLRTGRTMDAFVSRPARGAHRLEPMHVGE